MTTFELVAAIAGYIAVASAFLVFQSYVGGRTGRNPKIVLEALSRAVLWPLWLGVRLWVWFGLGVFALLIVVFMPVFGAAARAREAGRKHREVAMSVDHRELAIAAFNRALESIESAKTELNLNRSSLALLDAARALQAAGAAHYHLAHVKESAR